jgi:hypothetical protein
LAAIAFEAKYSVRRSGFVKGEPCYDEPRSSRPSHGLRNVQNVALKAGIQSGSRSELANCSGNSYEDGTEKGHFVDQLRISAQKNEKRQGRLFVSKKALLVRGDTFGSPGA